VAILGLTFKENIPDLRNTRVIDIVRELTDYGIEVMVHDPFANPGEAREYYGLELQPLGKIADVHAVIVTVAHDPYRAMGLKKVVELCTDGAPVVLDIKGIFNAKEAEQLGAMYWRL
jgi:UDP-N-acetyl-D-galactosamine dehydrogenase